MLKVRLLKAALFTPMPDQRWGLPLNLVGKPGIAKSALIKGIAKAMGVHCQSLTPGRDGEAAFGVVPFPAKIDGRTVLTYPVPEWSLRFNGGGEDAGILFLDEMNTADRALAPSLHSMIQDCQCGAWTGGPRIRVIAAMNPTDHATSGDDTSAANSNRLCWLYVDGPDADQFGEYLLSGSGANIPEIDTKKEEARVMREWPKAWAKASALVSSFLRRRPELLHKMPKNGDPKQSGPWPSPRTWDMSARVVASGEIHSLTDIEIDELISGCIGTDAASEFIAWQTEQDLPDPKDVLDGEGFEHDPARLDRTEAVLSACASFLISDPQDKRVVAMWDLIAEISKDAKDIAIPAVKVLAKAELSKLPAARKVLASFHDVIQAGQ